MLKKLRIKFVLINMVLVTVMLSILFGLVYYFTRADLERESMELMRSVAAKPQSSFLPGRAESVQLPYFTLEFNPFGDIVITAHGSFDLDDSDFLEEIVTIAAGEEQDTGVIDKYGLRFYRDISPLHRRLIFADISSEQATLRHLVKLCVLLGAASFAVFFVISLLLARWAVKPVDAAWRQQKQFVADASHELKTPLTVIMTNAELLQDKDCGFEARAQFSENILTMSQRMRALVERLLELARADNASKESFSPVELSTLVSRAMLPFEPVFYERGLTLESDIEEGITLSGNERHLEQVVGILLDNARKYSDPTGEVTVTLRRAAHGRIRLCVANPGEPISPEDRKNIFKRFYRVDKSRSDGGSFGLGLSIAESVAAEHGGKIRAESRSGQNLFIMELPLKASGASALRSGLASCAEKLRSLLNRKRT